jgi:endogenous inhibitor of DNA gyrase (YacG/DUF329 family)
VKQRCPTCRKQVLDARGPIFPFCSERCQMADLGRWLGEEYRVPEPQSVDGAVTSTLGSDENLAD